MIKKRSRESEEERIAVFLDFSEFESLEHISDLMTQLRTLGRIVLGKIYIDQEDIERAREKISQIAKLGLEPIVTVFSKEVRGALDIMENGYNPTLTSLLVGWGDDSVHSPLLEIREKKKIWIASTSHEQEGGLNNLADKIFIISP